jgi:antitoxin component YwqK of YwqJK toxin-antitoxin module
MIRVLLTYLFVSFFVSSFSQTDWELNEFEFNLEFVKQYPDSVIRFKYTYEQPEKVVYEWYYWVDTILHQTNGGYHGKLLDGSYEKFDAKGNMLVQGKFKGGLKNWEWKYWNASGELVRVENWSDGRKNGLFKNFDNSGRVIKEVNYRNGDLHGYTIVYSSDSIVSKKYFKNGQLKEANEGFIKRIF